MMPAGEVRRVTKGLFIEVPGETVWKSEWGGQMTYALGHEKELLHRSIRHRMGEKGKTPKFVLAGAAQCACSLESLLCLCDHRAHDLGGGQDAVD
jgi:hypothetical protein